MRKHAVLARRPRSQRGPEPVRGGVPATGVHQRVVRSLLDEAPVLEVEDLLRTWRAQSRGHCCHREAGQRCRPGSGQDLPLHSGCNKPSGHRAAVTSVARRLSSPISIGIVGWGPPRGTRGRVTPSVCRRHRRPASPILAQARARQNGLPSRRRPRRGHRVAASSGGSGVPSGRLASSVATPVLVAPPNEASADFGQSRDRCRAPATRTSQGDRARTCPVLSHFGIVLSKRSCSTATQRRGVVAGMDALLRPRICSRETLDDRLHRCL
jgi:hypothetical protein